MSHSSASRLADLTPAFRLSSSCVRRCTLPSSNWLGERAPSKEDDSMGLTKRKDSWYIEFPVLDNGKALTLAQGIAGAKLKRWKVGSLNKTVAKQQEALIKTELMKGTVKSDRVAPVLFSEWVSTYLGLEEVKVLSTFQDRYESVHYQLIPFFGNKLLIDITPDDVEAFRAQRRLRNGGVPSVATINSDHAVLKHILSVAERRGLAASNVAKRVPMPDPKNERDRVMSPEEWERLYDAAADHLKPILLVAYHLGPRLGEILNLTWDRVDLSRGFIKLRSIDTKTREPREVPLTPVVLAVLRDLSKVRSLTCPYVFQYEGKPIKRVKRAFHAAVRRAGIKDLRFHDLRHCAATNLRRAGVDTVTAMKIVGHKSEKMHRRYNSVSEDDLKKAAGKLDTYLSNTVITPAESSHQPAPVSA
jgi:integrase